MLPSEFDKKEIEYAHLNLDLSKVDFDRLRDPFPLYGGIEDFKEILKAMREPRNFYFTCKYILNIDPAIFQLVILEELWKRSFPMLIGTRGMSKTFLLALLSILRMLITQGSKILITSSSFRQAKFVFDYMETIWYNAPVLRDLVGSSFDISHQNDFYKFKIGDSTTTAVPIGDGSRIRGLRANYIITEEFGSIPIEIFEVVIGGFGASASNPIENIKSIAKMNKMKQKGLWSETHQKKMDEGHRPNQIILSGTAGYDFQHFAKYWKQYRAFVHSKGDVDKLTVALGKPPDKDFDWKDYSVIRIPLDLVPEGMMDKKNISRARSTSDQSRFDIEYNSVFAKDSTGFYPRLLVESCVCRQPILIGNEKIQFTHALYGEPNCEYVMGVDPASESDNFAIAILEVHPTHTRVVYGWTTTRERMRERVVNKTTDENSFYTYVGKKIRRLMQVFNCRYIALDSQGGGIGVMEALHDLRTLESGEIPIWPLLTDDKLNWPNNKNYMYDDEGGLHIIEMVSMSRADYVVSANHEMKRALENKMLLFPNIDGLSLTLAELSDNTSNREYDTLQDCIIEIEQLKEEISSITHTTSMTGRDKFDTPEIMNPGGKRGRMRKDRYSATLIAFFLASRMTKISTIDYSNRVSGGFAQDYKNRDIEGQPLYVGADWFCKASNGSMLGSVVNPAGHNPRY